MTAVTADGVLWTLRWRDDPAAPERRAEPAPPRIVSVTAGHGGRLLFATTDGLLLDTDGGAPARIAEGAFTDAVFPPGGAAASGVIAARSDGRIVRLER
ncbi:MAG: hypothetical protein J7M38_15200 [Armatimonadetes bacterium]|nr:hypothetical protein [Armatimonadota bacterium]